MKIQKLILDFNSNTHHNELMIEIAFDEHITAEFKGKPYPVLEVPTLKGAPFTDYLSFAQSAFKTHQNNQHIIIMEDENLFDTNKLGLALFIRSCFENESPLECVVFKTRDMHQAFEAYKPYIAASIGIKYILRLAHLSPTEIYKELKCLNYLGFTLKENYATKSIVYRMTGQSPLKRIEAHTIFDALTNIGLMKAISLAGITDNIELEVFTQSEPEQIDLQELVKETLKRLSAYIEIE